MHRRFGLSSPAMMRMSLLLVAVAACSKAPPPEPEVKELSFKPLLSPAGVPDVTTISDEVRDRPERVSIDVRLLAPKAIRYRQLDWLLDSVHRQAEARRGFEHAPRAQAVDIRVYHDPNAARDEFIARVRSEGGEPVKEIRIPYPLGAEVEKMLAEHAGYGKVRPTAEAEDETGKLVLRVPYVDGRTDEPLPKLGYGRAIQEWSSWALELFDKYPALADLTFLGEYRGKEVVFVQVTRAQYEKLGLRDAEENLGEFQATYTPGLVSGKLSEAQLMAKMAAERRKVYGQVLGRLPGEQVRVAGTLR